MLYDVTWNKFIPALQGWYTNLQIHDYLKAHGVTNLSDDEAIQYICENGGQVWVPFKCFGVSKNTNSFGLFGVRLLSKKGEFYECAANAR